MSLPPPAPRTTGHRLRPAATPGLATALATALAAALLVATPAGAATATSTPVLAAAAQSAATERARVPRGFPRARTTGARGDLRTIGSRTITRNGAVLKNVRVLGQLTIEARNVRIHNVRVETGASYGILVWAPRARITRTTVVGTPGRTLAGIAAYERGTVRAKRVNVSRVEDGVRLADDSSLVHSYVHHLAGSSSSHYDGVTADGYRRWVIRHNTILNRHGQTGAVWVADSRYGGSAGLLARNFLAGGGYTVYAGTGVGNGVRVRRNRFSTRFHDRGGYWGVAYEWKRHRNVWKGNRWADGGRAGRVVRP